MQYPRKFKWKIPEYEHKPKKIDWYFALGIISISATIASFLLNNILFSIFILISALTLAIYGSRKPRILNIEIDDHGVLVNDTFYLFSTLKSFWIEKGEGIPKIIIESEKTFVPYLVIPMKESDINNLRIFLLEHLKEKELTEPLPQKIMEYLGF